MQITFTAFKLIKWEVLACSLSLTLSNSNKGTDNLEGKLNILKNSYILIKELLTHYVTSSKSKALKADF